MNFPSKSIHGSISFGLMATNYFCWTLDPGLVFRRSQVNTIWIENGWRYWSISTLIEHMISKWSKKKKQEWSEEKQNKQKINIVFDQFKLIQFVNVKTNTKSVKIPSHIPIWLSTAQETNQLNHMLSASGVHFINKKLYDDLFTPSIEFDRSINRN